MLKNSMRKVKQHRLHRTGVMLNRQGQGQGQEKSTKTRHKTSTQNSKHAEEPKSILCIKEGKFSNEKWRSLKIKGTV